MNRKIVLILVISLLLAPILFVESSDAASSSYTVTIGYAFDYEEPLDQKYTYAENAVPYTISPDTGTITDSFGNIYLYNSASNSFWSKSEMMRFYDSDYNGCFDLGCYIADDNKNGYFVHEDVYYFSKGSNNEKSMQEFIYTAGKELPQNDEVLASNICMYKINSDNNSHLFFNNVDHTYQNKCLIEPSVLRYNKCPGQDVTLRIDSVDKSLICYPSTTYRGNLVSNGICVGETVKLDYYNGLLSLSFSTADLSKNFTVSVDVTTQGLKSVEDTGDNNLSLLITSIILIVACVLLIVIILLLKYKR